MNGGRDGVGQGWWGDGKRGTGRNGGERGEDRVHEAKEDRREGEEMREYYRLI